MWRASHSFEEVQPGRAPDFGKRRARMGLAVASRIHGARWRSRAVTHRRRGVLLQVLQEDLEGLSGNSLWRKVMVGLWSGWCRSASLVFGRSSSAPAVT